MPPLPSHLPTLLPLEPADPAYRRHPPPPSTPDDPTVELDDPIGFRPPVRPPLPSEEVTMV